MVRNVVLLLEVFAFLYGFAAIYGKKMKCGIYEVVFVLVEMMLFVAINEKSIPSYFVSLSYIFMGIYCIVRFDALLKKAIVNNVIVIAIVWIVQAICYIVISYVVLAGSAQKYGRELLSSTVCFVVFMFVIPHVKLKDLSDFLLKQNKLLGVLGSFIVVILGSKIWEIKKNGTIYADEYIPIIYFFLLLFVLIWEWQKAKREAERKKTQLEMNAFYYDAYEGLIRSVREKQHDFKNHINAVAGMIYTNNTYEELVDKQKKYFAEVLGEMEDVSLLTLVENPLLSGFLVSKIREAETKGIRVTRNCIWKSKEMKLPEYKLVEMMGILLDNAVEATEKLETNRNIQVNLGQEEELLVFSIVNTYEGELLSSEIFEAGSSSKGRGRGLGLAKLRRLTEEVGGAIYMEHGWKGPCRTVKFEIRIPV